MEKRLRNLGNSTISATATAPTISSTSARTEWPAAKCSFYAAKGSSHAQLLEGKENLLRMRQDIPLSEAELAAVDDGLAAGPTARQLRASELTQIASAESKEG